MVAQATYSEISGAWNISGKSLDRGNPLVTNTYGTLRVNAYKLLEDAVCGKVDCQSIILRKTVSIAAAAMNTRFSMAL